MLDQLWRGASTQAGETPEALLLGTAAYRAAQDMMPVGSVSEQTFKWLGMRCKVDIAAPGRAVFDLKTTADPKKYGLTVEQLKRDPQAICYAKAVGAHVAHWVYFSTKVKLPKPHVVTAKWTPEELEEAARGVVETIQYMKRVAVMPYPPVSAVEAVSEDAMPLPICQKWFVDCPALVQCWQRREEKLARIRLTPSLARR